MESRERIRIDMDFESDSVGWVALEENWCIGRWTGCICIKEVKFDSRWLTHIFPAISRARSGEKARKSEKKVRKEGEWDGPRGGAAGPKAGKRSGRGKLV